MVSAGCPAKAVKGRPAQSASASRRFKCMYQIRREIPWNCPPKMAGLNVRTCVVRETENVFSRRCTQECAPTCFSPCQSGTRKPCRRNRGSMVTAPSATRERRRCRGRPESLRSRRENGLKMRAVFFTRDHPDVDVFETGVFKQLMQFNFTEAEPMIGLQFARLLD